MSQPTASTSKYQAVHPVTLSDRTWPDKQITQAPLWCSVDLRDGNQALIEPMTVDQKTRLWTLLVNMGFKEIEIGFPSASETEYEFTRKLIEENLIPDDVTVQVLVQARDHLIKRTFAALKGIRRAVVHVYNSTSTIQRERVFAMDTDGIEDIAVAGAKLLQEHAALNPETEWVFQYSPESFTGTELPVALRICNAVIEQWQPTADHPCIINLPATVEMSTPNIFADQVEWMHRNLARRDAVILSVHTHNDRGTGVAATELALMAGADRVEGTLMGNGERTGNLDIVTLGLNLFSQGIDPKLDFTDIQHIVSVYQECTQMEVHPRHPYAGELVFTAFSGSHQDAIRKCLKIQKVDENWQVAYLPIDPADIGRRYDEVIRINSQSGKGGVAYILEQDYGYRLPRPFQIHFSQIVQKTSELAAKEVSPDTIAALFERSYMAWDTPFTLREYCIKRNNDKQVDQLDIVLATDTDDVSLTAQGKGPIAAFIDALKQHTGREIVVVTYDEHAMSLGENAQAATYMQLRIDGEAYFGVGVNDDILMASFKAILSAVNQAV
jgi:2-isopropylmalate synthase